MNEKTKRIVSVIVVLLLLIAVIFLICKLPSTSSKSGIENAISAKQDETKKPIELSKKEVIELESLVKIEDIQGIGDVNLEEEVGNFFFYEEILVSYAKNVATKNDWLSWEPLSKETVINDGSEYEYELWESEDKTNSAIVSVGYLGKYGSSNLFVLCIYDEVTNIASYYEISVDVLDDYSFAINVNGEMSDENKKIASAIGNSSKYFGLNGAIELLESKKEK